MRYALTLGSCLLFTGPAIAEPAFPRVAPSVVRINSEIPDLSDILKDQLHRVIYNRLMAHWGDGVPTWVRRFNQTGDGVQDEARGFLFKGQTYQIAGVSKPHATDAGTLYVIFNDFTGAPVAWGYYVVDGRGYWIGRPPLDLAEHVEKLIARRDQWN